MLTIDVPNSCFYLNSSGVKIFFGFSNLNHVLTKSTIDVYPKYDAVVQPQKPYAPGNGHKNL